MLGVVKNEISMFADDTKLFVRNTAASYIMKDGPNDGIIGTSICEKGLGVHIDNELKFNL